MSSREKIDSGLRSIFHRHLRQIHWQAVETGLTGGGVPDSNGCFGGVEFWVEHKSTHHWKVKFEPEQVAWIDRRTRAGGRVWIAVRKHHDGGPRIGPPVDDLWLISGTHVKLLFEHGLRIAPAQWHGGPSKWDWVTIHRILTSNYASHGPLPPLE